MRDLIVTNIKQFIILLRERGSTIDTRCVQDRIKKTPFAQSLDVKQEIDNTINLFATENQKLEHSYLNQICFQHDLVQDINYMFTANDIIISVVSSLIYVSSNQI